MDTAPVIMPPVGGRYQLHDKLGEGGMGSVFRAADRLTGETVALKRINVGADQLRFASFTETVTGDDLRLSLAREFQTLASLRHPHIISVLDYGFDAAFYPYFTMAYLPDALRLTTAALAKPAQFRLDLLIQTLQALTYLHRQGILHRDLKPANVLVVDDQVLVVDFGLAIEREAEQIPAGTLAYMAPEILVGQTASEASDLYAVGLMAFEMFAGRHPFEVNSQFFLDQVWSETPDLTLLRDINDDVAAVIGRLLAKEPATRFPGAMATIEALCVAAGVPLPEESSAIRESFLQAAQFVGRREEMDQLLASLNRVDMGRGTAWLVGGSSGVGKSRLLHELRTRALVGGVQVIKGQAVQEGTVRYQVWREPLRRLVLNAELNDYQAAVLKPLVPDIERLLDRSIPDAPWLEGQAARQRLLSVIVDLFRRQPQPVLLVLEDLHWASDESLAVYRQLQRVVNGLPLMIVGSYRTDERPQLPRALPGVSQIFLDSLNEESMTELSVSMLGEAGRQQEILSFLQRETEGNAFFLVEVVRALAEEAGRLSQIGRMVLPETVFPEGVRSVVQRRLSRVPEWAWEPLCLAAVAGRQIDLRLLLELTPEINIDEWLTTCVNTAVVELRDGGWRLAHDKLREGMLADLTEPAKPHSRVARAIESVYPNDPEKAGALAYHWGAAQQPQKERRYARLAGDHAATQHANDEATNYYSRSLELTGEAEYQLRYELLLAREKALDLLGRREAQADDLTTLEALVGHLPFQQQAAVNLRRANYALLTADYETADRQAQAIINRLEGAGEVSTILVEAYYLWGQALVEQDNYQSGRQKYETAYELARELQATQIEFQILAKLGTFHLFHGDNSQAESTFEYLVNGAQKAEDPGAEMVGLYGLSLLAGRSGNLEKAREYNEQRLAISRRVGHRLEEGNALLALASYAGQLHDYQSAQTHFEQALAVYRELGYQRGEQTTLSNLGFLSWQLGRYQDAASSYEESLVIAQSSDSRFQIALSLINLGHVARDAGEYATANDYYDRALQIAREIENETLIGYSLNGLGIIANDIKSYDQALAFHNQALDVRRKLQNMPLVMEDLAGLARTALQQGNVSEARNRLTEVLVHMNENPALHGAERALEIHYICWRVLQAAGEVDRARKILTYAYNLIQEQANHLPDETARHIYLEKIPIHRKITQAFR